MSVHDANAADGSLGGEAGRVADAFAASAARRSTFEAPYRHYLLENVFPADVADALADLPFAAPDLAGVSGGASCTTTRAAISTRRRWRAFPSCERSPRRCSRSESSA